MKEPKMIIELSYLLEEKEKSKLMEYLNKLAYLDKTQVEIFKENEYADESEYSYVIYEKIKRNYIEDFMMN